MGQGQRRIGVQSPWRGTVRSVEELAPGIFSVWLEPPPDRANRSFLPGQFVSVRVPDRPDLLLRRPFSVADVEHRMLRVVFRVRGPGTEHLSRSCPGAQWDLLGPLGRPVRLPRGKDVLVCAGGVGAAPLYYLTKHLLKRKNSRGRVSVLLGAKSRSELLLVKEFRRLGVSLTLVTEDGSAGERGLVTEHALRMLEAAHPERTVVFACGPSGMLKSLGTIAAGFEVWAFIEERMGCGTGVCYCCAVARRRGGYLRVCQEGPVVRLVEVVL